MLTVRAYGEDRIADAFGAMARRVRDLSPAWSRTGAAIVATAVPLTPVLTGRLVATLRHEATSAGATVSAGGRGVVYAGVQNYGWPARNIRATRFLNIALELNQSTAEREALSEVERVAHRVGLK